MKTSGRKYYPVTVTDQRAVQEANDQLEVHVFKVGVEVVVRGRRLMHTKGCSHILPPPIDYTMFSINYFSAATLDFTKEKYKIF